MDSVLNMERRQEGDENSSALVSFCLLKQTPLSLSFFFSLSCCGLAGSPTVSQSVISVTEILGLAEECTAVRHMDNTRF